MPLLTSREDRRTLPEDATRSEYVAWLDRTAGGTYLPTPLVYDGGLYVLSSYNFV